MKKHIHGIVVCIPHGYIAHPLQKEQFEYSNTPKPINGLGYYIA